jgi:hypothetical protein
MASRLIRMSYFRGDPRIVPARIAITGETEPLKRELESAAGRAFQQLPILTHSADAEFLQLPADDPWKWALSMKCRFDGPLATQIGYDLAALLTYGHWVMKCHDFVVLSLCEREPELVAFNMLYALWFLCYFKEPMVHADELQPHVTIAWESGIELVHGLLADNHRRFWQKLQDVYDQTPKLPFLSARLDRTRVAFHAVEWFPDTEEEYP